MEHADGFDFTRIRKFYSALVTKEQIGKTILKIRICPVGRYAVTTQASCQGIAYLRLNLTNRQALVKLVRIPQISIDECLDPVSIVFQQFTIVADWTLASLLARLARQPEAIAEDSYEKFSGKGYVVFSRC